ncbi:MAG TPA: hypothetical protein VF039_05515 [Longimicrobiales bacterium]
MASLCRIAFAALLVLGATPLSGQQRAERFPEPSTVLEAAAPDELAAERSSYWLEGALIGAAAGVALAILTVDPAQACPALPGVDCREDPGPVIVHGVLFGVAGALAGAMLGASTTRAAN